MNKSPRFLIFRFRLARVDYSIILIPGKLLYTAVTLSRAPRATIDNDVNLEEETECLLEVTINSLLASQKRLSEYLEAQVTDPLCSTISKYCKSGWPDKNKVESNLKPFWKNQGELTVNLLLYGKHMVVPTSPQKETLRELHEGHQGVQRCRLRARYSVWWPGIMAQE